MGYLGYGYERVAYSNERHTHTSGTTQPLALRSLAVLSTFFGCGLRKLADPNSSNVYDIFDFCGILSYAFKKAFVPQNYYCRFRRSGIWPLDSSKLLNIERPLSSENSTRRATVTEMMSMLQRSARPFVKIFRSNPSWCPGGSWTPPRACASQVMKRWG